MANRIKDTDYLVISARVKAMETGLLTQERMEQVLEARSDEEAVKILQECGYPQLDAAHPEAMDAALSVIREATLSDLAAGAPDIRYIDVFKLKRISRHHSCEKKCNGYQGKQAHKTEQNPFSNVFDHSGFRPSSGFLTGTNFAWFISGCCRRIAPSLLQTMTQEPQ